MGGNVTARSLVFPIYRNEANIPALMQAVAGFHGRYAGDIEFVIVIDGSPHGSGTLLGRA